MIIESTKKKTSTLFLDIRISGAGLQKSKKGVLRI